MLLVWKILSLKEGVRTGWVLGRSRVLLPGILSCVTTLIAPLKNHRQLTQIPIYHNSLLSHIWIDKITLSVIFPPATQQEFFFTEKMRLVDEKFHTVVQFLFWIFNEFCYVFALKNLEIYMFFRQLLYSGMLFTVKMRKRQQQHK